MSDNGHNADEGASLRRGWTTGSCAAAAVRAACEALITGECPAMAEIELPGGGRPSFAVAICESDGASATAGIVKDAGDDPDITHGALVKATVRRGAPGDGIVFRAGDGVGTVTRPGLALSPGEPAINPVPRQMIRLAIEDAARRCGATLDDLIVEISIPGGEVLAKKTLNSRLGILGGLSILGTTGIVVPFSCAAWIHSIHRGIDVARACGVEHIAGATGSASEAAIQRMHALPDAALIEMGDFVGGMLKYLRQHPIPRVTIAGGFAKMTKLGQGLLDLHSKRGRVDNEWLAGLLRNAGGSIELCALAREANTAQHVLELAREADAKAAARLGDLVAEAAWSAAARALGETGIALDVAVFSRAGSLVGKTEARRAHSGLPR
ncbi:MAG: cobalt-precorrin-5B (C(1))-methyltransferase [Rhodomicrobium sp.]